MTTAKRTDTGSRLIRATPDAVYRALTDPVALVQWLPPNGMSGRIEAFDLREGGRYRMILIYDDPDHATRGKASADEDVVDGRFVVLQPGRRFAQSAVFESDDPKFAGEMTVTWDLVAVDRATQVTVTASDVPVGISQADHEEGLNSSLRNLAGYLE